MKKLILAVMLIASVAMGQTTNIVVQTNSVVVTNVVTTTTNALLPGVDIGQVGSDLLAFISDASPFYTNSIIASAGGVNIDKRWGGLVDIGIPLNANGQISMGFAGMFLGGGSGQKASFYTGAVNLQAAKSVTLFGQTFQGFICSGPGYNNNTHEIILYSATGASWNTQWGPGQFTISGGGVNVSDAPGIGYFGVLSYGFKL